MGISKEQTVKVSPDVLFQEVSGEIVLLALASKQYFGLDEEFNFIDLDVLVTGAVIPEIARGFDRYWNAELTYPAGALSDVTREEYADVRRDNQQYLEKIHNEKGFSGEILVASGQEVVFNQSIGLASQEYQVPSNTLNTWIKNMYPSGIRCFQEPGPPAEFLKTMVHVLQVLG